MAPIFIIIGAKKTSASGIGDARRYRLRPEEDSELRDEPFHLDHIQLSISTHFQFRQWVFL